ncbi:MAG: alanine dehydrogenase [Deltaproteobacteria bacterium]|nr:MAG: alanine dehydrogenase [Deltaproteobacteria bacterium]
MIIGIPKEVKVMEERVGMVPAGVRQLVDAGHTILVERGAGLGSGIPDARYEAAGAELLDSADALWQRAEMIVKVKEPVAQEYDRIQRGQTIFTYFHLAAVPELAKVLLDKEVTAIAYETVESPDGQLPLLKPMSEVAGKMSIQVGARCLEREYGGKGLLLGGVPGVRRGRVVIIGGGVVGTNAAKVAVGMGAEVIILDVNLNRLEYLDDVFMGRVQTLYSDVHNIEKSVAGADLVIGAVLMVGARAPRLVTRDLLRQMQTGSVVVDVAVDQGGCIETCKPTTHADPTYVVEGVVHYCVANMPGAVAHTSTLALTNATIRYARRLAGGPLEALRADPYLAKGLNTYRGHVTHAAVAQALGLPYTPFEKLLDG